MIVQANIRKLIREDAAAIHEINLAANGGQTTWKLSSFEGELDNPINHYIGYEVAGELVGFIGCSFIFDELAVNNFAVSPAHKRQGIGQKLLEALLTLAKEQGARIFHLEVRVSNRPAISLYEKFGFVQIDRRKNYYEQPVEDAFIFQKVL